MTSRVSSLEKDIARDLVEHQILWRLRGGNTSIWFDNWTNVGDLYNVVLNSREWDEKYLMVKDLVQNGGWNEEVISQFFPLEVAENIINKIKPLVNKDVHDSPILMLESTGKFIIKSVWQQIRERE